MTITQTVDIPANRRLTIDVPREVPVGRTILVFTPAPDRKSCLTAEEEDAVELAFEALDAFEDDLKRATPQELAIMRDTVVPINMADVVANQSQKEIPSV